MDCVKQMEESCLWLTLEPLFWLAEMTLTHSCSPHALPPLPAPCTILHGSPPERFMDLKAEVILKRKR